MRAKRLREEIERLKRGDEEEGNGEEPPRSSREFVEKRMHELDEQQAESES